MLHEFSAGSSRLLSTSSLKAVAVDKSGWSRSVALELSHKVKDTCSWPVVDLLI